MAAGEYVSVSSQADSERADTARERRELQDDPASELEELAGIYGKRGLDADLAHRVAEQLMERDALGAHERDELGNIAGNNGEARSSRARVGGLVFDWRRTAASAGGCGAGSNADRGSLYRVPRVSGTARGGRGKSGGRTNTQGDRPRYVLGRLGNGGDGRNRRGVREPDLVVLGSVTLQSPANVCR